MGIPGTFVWKDDLCVAFMTVAPLRPGHTLVVPIEEVDHCIDLSPRLGATSSMRPRSGAAIQDALDPTRVGVMIAGLEVPHAHIHLVPIDGMHDLDFSNADDSARREDIEASAAKIREALETRGASGVAG